MKYFDLAKAKNGYPVCTRDGRDARIVCFDRRHSDFPIIALINYGEYEQVMEYAADGQWIASPCTHNSADLMMKD